MQFADHMGHMGATGQPATGSAILIRGMSARFGVESLDSSIISGSGVLCGVLH